MQVEIEYCVTWNYLPHATRLAAELKQAFGVEATLKKGGGGVFEVTVDGKTVFSKKSAKRFPEAGEVSRSLRA